jgi:hypothetical protein
MVSRKASASPGTAVPVPDLTNAVRAAQLKAARASLHQTKVWHRSLTELKALCLVSGYTRPSGRAAGPWGDQTQVAPPGSDKSPEIAEIESVREQIASALEFEHPCYRLHGALPDDLVAAAAWICDHRLDISEARRERTSRLSHVAKALSGWTTELYEAAPECVSTAKLPHVHVAFVDCLAHAMGWPDDHLVEHCVLGCPPVGDIPDSGVFVAKEDPAAMRLDELSHEGWLNELERLISREGPDPEKADDLRTLWARTQKEVTDGWATPVGNRAALAVVYAAEIAAGRCRPMVRFGVSQHGKLRPCDNGRSSFHNSCTHLHETIRCESVDFPARVAGLFYERLGERTEWGMALGTEDIASAYRRAMCSEPGLTLFAQWDPELGEVVYFRLQGFNFGLKSAVVWFNRLSMFLCRAAVRFCPVTTGCYFDDFASCEPSFCGQTGRTALRSLAELVGLPFSDDVAKSHPLSSTCTWLGVEFDFTGFSATRVVACCVTARRQAGLLEFISDVLRRGTFDDTLGADRLCGKLQFSLAWSTNRVGRAAMQPLHAAASRRQRISGLPEPITAAARLALEFFERLLTAGLPGRRFDLRRGDRAAILIWSDAMYEPDSGEPAGVGFVVFVPSPEGGKGGRWFYSYGSVGEEFISRFLARKQYIGQLEQLAAVAVYYTLAGVPGMREQLRDAPVVHFVDNYAAAQSLCKGYATAVDSALIVHSMWALVAELGCCPWLSYIRTKGNVADIPSRYFQCRTEGEEEEFAVEMEYIRRGLGAQPTEFIEMVVPSSLDWVDITAALRASELLTGGAAPVASASSAAPPRKRRRPTPRPA